MLGDFVKNRRKALGWSCQQLAEKSNISYFSLYKIEKGKRPSLKILNKILKAFCLNIDDILSDKNLTAEEVLYLENKKHERLYYEWQR